MWDITIFFYMTYVLFLGLEDKKYKKIKNKHLGIILLVGLLRIISIMIIDNIKLVISLGIALLIIYRIGLIGGGDLKLFLISLLFLNPIILLSLISLTLLLGFILIMLKIECKPPLIFYFSILALGYYMNEGLIFSI